MCYASIYPAEESIGKRRRVGPSARPSSAASRIGPRPPSYPPPRGVYADEHDAVTISEESTEHEAVTEHEAIPEEVTEYEHEAVPEEVTEYEHDAANEDEAIPEIHESHEPMESHEREAATSAASSALNEGDRSVIKLMNLDVEAIAALELLGAHDSVAKSKLVMKVLLKEALLSNPSAFVSRAV